MVLPFEACRLLLENNIIINLIPPLKKTSLAVNVFVLMLVKSTLTFVILIFKSI